MSPTIAPPSVHFTDTASLARFGDYGPQPQFLIDSEHFKALVAGLAPGQQIPPHPEALALYYFLSGSGVMIIDGNELPVAAGSTVIALAGVARGIRAETPLIFLAAKSN